MKIKLLLITLYFGLAHSSVFGVEINKKAHDQAIKDLELSKKQASLLLQDELKKYDLSRLPPHYKKMLEEKLFGKAPDIKELKKMKTQYDKVVQASFQETARGKGGDISLLNKNFKNIIAGKTKLASHKIPYRPSVSAVINKPNLHRNKKNNIDLKSAKVAKTTFLPENLGQVQDFDLFIKDSKKFLDNRGVVSIFDRHSEVYLNEIYSLMNLKGDK